MRRQAKASSAGSNSEQGNSLGSLRRALAVRGASSSAGGSGARSYGRLLTLLALGLLSVLVFAPSASAAPKQIVNAIGSPELGEFGGRFRSPRGVAVNQTGAGGVPAGTFYVVDSKNRRVQRFGPTGAFVSTWGFGVRSGSPEFEICTKAEECRRDFGGGPAGAAGTLDEPQGIAVDQANGNVYVSDPSVLERRIDVFSAKGAFEGAFGFGVIDGTGNFQFCTSVTGCHTPSETAAPGGAFPGALGGVAVDATGNVYVANQANRRVDVFKPTLAGTTVTAVEFLRAFGWGVATGAGAFEVCTVSANCKVGIASAGLGQFANNSPTDVAIDSEGNVFVLDAGNKRIEQFSSVPAPITASFGSAALEGVFGAGATLLNIATDPSSAPNHLLVSGGRLASAGKIAIAELDNLGANVLGAGKAHGEDLQVTNAAGLAVAKASIGGNLYLSTESVAILRGVFVLNELPTIEAVTNIAGTSATFHGKVVSNNIAVNYHFEYSTDGKAWTSVPATDAALAGAPGTISVEASAKGLTGSQLYRVRLVQNRPLGGGVATSAETEFTTLAEKPAIQGTVASPIKDTSATFNAYLDPQNEATTYRFEYGAADCSANPCTALPISEANGGGLRLITQTATGLEPGTLYHFRLVATNGSGTTEGPDRTFETFAAAAQLPDNRAYELVTPPDTGGITLGIGAPGEVEGRGCFDTFTSTADGNGVVSLAEGGSLPGLTGNGRLDLYESVRDPEKGWSTIAKSTSGAQTLGGQAGFCSSPDHLYSTASTLAGPIDEGSLVVEGKASNYIRVPDGVVDPACSPEPAGHFELIGCGSLGADPEADARWITSGATHVLFMSSKQLEPAAPASGTQAIYDRSPGGPTHVVSLLPGEVTPAISSFYQGASTDGSVALFSIGTGPTIGSGSTLYARLDNGATIMVAGGSSVAVGATLTCAGGPTTGAGAPALTYKWLRNGAAIGAATSSTYTAQAADAGAVVQCQVTATNTVADVKGGFVGSTQTSVPAIVVEPVPATTPPTAPNTIAAPSGTVSSGSSLSCATTGTWGGGPTFTRQWYRNGVAIAGATGTTYTLTAADVATPAVFQCAVTGTNAGGSVTKVSANKATGATPGVPNPTAPAASSKLGSLNVEPAGASDDGERVFYLQGGNIVAVDTATQVRTPIANSANAEPVNVSPDGSHVYFISKSVLTGTEENEEGQKAAAGQGNLYVWDGGSETTRFVTVVDPKDLGNNPSLTRWASDAVSPNQTSQRGRANDPSRTTPDGSVLLFESRANVSGYDSGGHIEIYRYDAGDGSLDCVSCPAPGVAAQGDAALQRLVEQGGGGDLQDQFVPTTSLVHIQNVTDDGQKVFFESKDALVPADVNGAWDVYEWKVGQQPYLISSGHGSLPSFLYGMTPSGSDVFFTSAERLVPQDLSTVISIYDAREDGGFPVAQSEPPCQGDNCQGTPGTAPALAGAGSASFQGAENETRQQQRPCRKHTRRVTRNGRTRCVKKHRKPRHHRANSDRRTAR